MAACGQQCQVNHAEQAAADNDARAITIPICRQGQAQECFESRGKGSQQLMLTGWVLMQAGSCCKLYMRAGRTDIVHTHRITSTVRRAACRPIACSNAARVAHQLKTNHQQHKRRHFMRAYWHGY
jgi:hypothetical protein